MAAKNPKRRENEAVWEEMRRQASDADVRPTPLSKTRTLPGNPRFGDLTASLNKEVPKKFDPLTGASATLNPAPAPAAAARGPGVGPDREKGLWSDVGVMDPQGAARREPNRSGGRTYGSVDAVASPSSAPTAQVWMSKSDAAGTTNAVILAPDAAAVERLKRSGYSVREDQTMPRGLELAGASLPPVAAQRAPGVYDKFGNRMPSPRMVSATGPDQNGRQSTWYATARDTEDVLVPGGTREDEGPTPIEIQRELSGKQYQGYMAAQARLAQEDAAWIAGQDDAQSIWDAQGVGTRMIEARRKKLGPLTLAEQEKIQGAKL